MADWISVKDRLPDKGEHVLCYFGEDMIASFKYIGNGFFDNIVEGVEYKNSIMYWMPLPEVPEERENDAPKLVHCKECRYGYDSGFKKNAVRCKFPPIGGYHPDEFFCAAGRRKEEEQNGE